MKRALLVAAATVGAAVPAAGALAACNGAFLSAAAIEACLGRPAAADQSGAVTKSFGKNVTVKRKDNPPEPPAAVNLWVSFAFDSAELNLDTRITLNELARALRGPRLEGKAFVVAGHTDAVGTADYNQTLSERRAAVVRDYLAGPGQVPADRLKAEGWGFSRPLNPADPTAAENRRVEVRVAD